MTDHRFPDINDDPSDLEAPSDAELDAIARILGDAAVWDEPDPDIEDRLVALITAEAAERPLPSAAPAPAFPTPTAFDTAAEHPPAPAAEHRPRSEEQPGGTVVDARHRFGAARIVLAAAAVVVAVAIGASVLRSSDPETGTEVALAPTDLAPSDAAGQVEVFEQAAGTQILLDVSGLPPAPEGSYYEAWLRKSPEVGVSAGTFHLRGGDSDIELWSGVSTDDYPLITVTIQEEGAGEASSGRVVLKGQIGS